MAIYSMTTPEKTYRAHLRRAYKAKHDKGLGKSVRMMAADHFTDLYDRRDPKVNGDHRPGKEWLRRRLVYIRGFVVTLRNAGLTKLV
jgi:hypothetical protein